MVGNPTGAVLGGDDYDDYNVVTLTVSSMESLAEGGQQSLSPYPI